MNAFTTRLEAAEARVLSDLGGTEPRRLTRVYAPCLIVGGAVLGSLFTAASAAPALLIALLFGVAAGYAARSYVSTRRRDRLRRERLLH